MSKPMIVVVERPSALPLVTTVIVWPAFINGLGVIESKSDLYLHQTHRTNNWMITCHDLEFSISPMVLQAEDQIADIAITILSEHLPNAMLTPIRTPILDDDNRDDESIIGASTVNLSIQIDDKFYSVEFLLSLDGVMRANVVSDSMDSSDIVTCIRISEIVKSANQIYQNILRTTEA